MPAFHLYVILPFSSPPFPQSAAIQVARQLSLTKSQHLSIKWNILDALYSLFPFSAEWGVNQKTSLNAAGREKGPDSWEIKDDDFKTSKSFLKVRPSRRRGREASSHFLEGWEGSYRPTHFADVSQCRVFDGVTIICESEKKSPHHKHPKNKFRRLPKSRPLHLIKTRSSENGELINKVGVVNWYRTHQLFLYSARINQAIAPLPTQLLELMHNVRLVNILKIKIQGFLFPIFQQRINMWGAENASLWQAPSTTPMTIRNKTPQPEGVVRLGGTHLTL